MVDFPSNWLIDIKIYRDKRDWWIGLYKANDGYKYFCIIPTVVFRYKRS